ncbi:MAG TPA: ATP-binding protein [Blastocatellia bacterium]|nr:ATP-binding protein [Blastocatellia bacterium]
MLLRTQQRRIVLFVIAIILPSFIVIALGLRLLSQERELAEKRWADERQRLARDLRLELWQRLEQIKEQELRSRAHQTEAAHDENPAVVFLATIEQQRLQLPWQTNPQASDFQRLLSEGAFARLLQQGEQQELTVQQFDKASECYRQAQRLASHPAQRVYATLLLARTLSKAHHEREAEQHYRTILAQPSLLDEQGIPFLLYAAERLVESKTAFPEVIARLRELFTEHRWLSPTAAYLLRDLTANLMTAVNGSALNSAAEALTLQTRQYIGRMEQALALQQDFPSVLPANGSATQQATRWFPYGEELWLLKQASPTEVIVVRAQEVFASLETLRGVGASTAALLAGNEPRGEFLGADFPGLKVAFSQQANPLLTRRWRLEQSFYLVALLLLLSGTFFCAWLLWHDMRRELRLVEMRSQFVASVSHELKTPLTAIRMFAETLLLGRSANQETQTEYLSIIVNESERLTRLLNDVLDFAKIEQGKKAYHFAPTSLPDVVQAAARALEYPLLQQGFRLQLALSDDLPLIRADADALQQAVLNLITNAMKYAGASRDIRLSLSRQADYAVLAVTDHGLGIPHSEQEKIFEKFYRAETPETKAIPGTGLGLTLVAHVVHAHGGRIDVQSTPGAGSTFSLYFPLEGNDEPHSRD